MNPALPRLLDRLLEAGSLPASYFSAAAFSALASLFDAGVLARQPAGSGFKVAVLDRERLAAWRRSRFPVAAFGPEIPPRAQAGGRFRDAKQARRAGGEIVLLRARRPAWALSGPARIDLASLTAAAGAACLLLHEHAPWRIEPSQPIALMENLECFLAGDHLPIGPVLTIYTAGRISERLLSWLADPALAGCRFIHCGDYDPTGLDEFLRLDGALGPRAELCVPAGLEELFSLYGKTELLRRSRIPLARLRGSRHPQVRLVMDLIDRHGAGLEQEALFLPR